MSKLKKNKESISENIASLLNSAPSGFHEDEEIDETSAKVLDEENEDFEEIHERSKIRMKNAPLLENLDGKYAGKVASRRKLKEFSDESEESENESLDIDEGLSDEYESENEEEQSENEDEQSENGEEQSEIDEDIEEESNEDDENFKHFKETDTIQEKRKGISVRNQLSIWEHLLEIRIQLQKSLSASNKLPIGENFTQLSEENEEFKSKLSDTKKYIGDVLNKFIDLQRIVIGKYPETKKLLSGKTQSKNEDSDEEITSESEVESEEDNEPKPKKLKKINEFEETLAKRHDLYKKYRNDTITKWNDKTRIGTLSKNNTNSHTITNQIEHILMNKSKLIKKSQLKRSNYQIIGEEENEEEETNNSNENIYDDDDFYHQLLRELIEFKSSDVTDPVQLGRQWIQLQNMRSKMKRKIDTRATKGRKIRYAVHSKLVNFMTPIEYRNVWTEEAKNELFGSLFGKKQL